MKMKMKMSWICSDCPTYRDICMQTNEHSQPKQTWSARALLFDPQVSHSRGNQQTHFISASSSSNRCKATLEQSTSTEILKSGSMTKQWGWGGGGGDSEEMSFARHPNTFACFSFPVRITKKWVQCQLYWIN